MNTIEKLTAIPRALALTIAVMCAVVVVSCLPEVTPRNASSSTPPTPAPPSRHISRRSRGSSRRRGTRSRISTQAGHRRIRSANLAAALVAMRGGISRSRSRRWTVKDEQALADIELLLCPDWPCSCPTSSPPCDGPFVHHMLPDRYCCACDHEQGCHEEVGDGRE